MPLNCKAAFVDLSLGKVATNDVPQSLTDLYLGGRGIGTYLLYNLLEPGIDPLSPENVLIVSAGLLTGTPVLSAACTHVAGKSPLTGLAGSATMGGFFGPELRFAGFDHIVIRGKADRPVYLLVYNGKVTIQDASRIWGADCFETQTLLREELDDEEIQVITIGLAGENQVRFANIRTGVIDAADDNGMGALMGFKNLKAIATRGTLPIEITDPEGILQCQATAIEFSQSPELTREEVVAYSHGLTACFGCATPCRHQYILNEGMGKSSPVQGPQYAPRAASADYPIHSGGMDSLHSDERITPRQIFMQECLYALVDSLGICKFSGSFLLPERSTAEKCSRFIELTTGLRYTTDQLIRVGERILNLERLFNIREGVARANDALPKQFFDKYQSGDGEISPLIDREKFETLLNEYYEIHGWDEQGRPTAATLKRLDLDREPSRLL